MSSSIERGKLVVFSAPSGTGKTTVCRKLLAEGAGGAGGGTRTSGGVFVNSISATTRAPRGAELDGIDYFFITRKEFEKRIEDARFLEYAVVHGEYYGTPRDFIIEQVRAGRYPLLDIDVKGAMQVRERAGADGEIEAVLIFLAPPSREELVRRLGGRGTETDEQIAKRLSIADEETRYRDRFDFVVVNDDLDAAVARAREIILGDGR